MSDLTVERVAELLAAATPGPWRYDDREHDETIYGGPDDIYVAQVTYDDQSGTYVHDVDADGGLIAAAPDIAALAVRLWAELEGSKESVRLFESAWRSVIARRAAGAPDLVTYDEAVNRLRSLPVEQRMTALGFVAVAERRRSRWSDNWWYWDADSTMSDPWDENEVLWTEAK